MLSLACSFLILGLITHVFTEASPGGLFWMGGSGDTFPAVGAVVRAPTKLRGDSASAGLGSGTGLGGLRGAPLHPPGIPLPVAIVYCRWEAELFLCALQLDDVS